MTHTTFDPHEFKDQHPGLVFGGASLFTIVVLALVSLAIMFGVYVVAENALQGFVDIARNAVSP